MKFASEHVIWTDELCSFQAISQSLTSLVVMREGSFDAVLRYYIRFQCTKSSVNFGGGCEMVFGIISAAGTWRLVKLHSKINTTLYKEILKKLVVPHLRTAINQPTVFKQENTPCHTMTYVKTSLSEENVTVMEWPAQKSWRVWNEWAKEINPKNLKELWTNLKGEWEKISVDEYKTLIYSASKRCQAVIKK